ncbi:MarR family transcriptional regulator [bacterium]|nr:MarR family transcriptional regulator [bacterium]
MLKEIFMNLIGNAIVASGRAIKVHNLNLYNKHGFEITPEQYLVLNMINDDENLSQNKLCELLYKDKSNMTRLISVLEEKGLVTKTSQSEKGKQLNVIKITEKGKALRSEITPVMIDSRKKYLDGISQDDMYICIKVLSQIQQNLESPIK